MMLIDLINIILLHSFYIYIMVYTISVIDVLIYINFKKKKIWYLQFKTWKIDVKIKNGFIMSERIIVHFKYPRIF